MNNYPFPVITPNTNLQFYPVIEEINKLKSRITKLEETIQNIEKQKENNYLKKDDNYHMI